MTQSEDENFIFDNSTMMSFCWADSKWQSEDEEFEGRTIDFGEHDKRTLFVRE
jgi:hypothetical protein